MSLEGVRFEIPGRFRHLRRVTVRYARWNLRCVHLIDERTDTLPAPIYPMDKARNASARRRVLDPDLLSSAPDCHGSSGEMAPLLRKLMTTQLIDTLVEHSAGNYRVMMAMAGELLMAGVACEAAQIDEKLYFEVFQSQPRRRQARGESRGETRSTARASRC